LNAGRSAGMYVVGLATTNPADAINPLCDVVIKDFHNLNYDSLRRKLSLM